MPIAALESAPPVLALPTPRWPASTLEQALKNRCSSRAFATQALSIELLSSLLWSAFGVNRRDSHGRTAPSAHNWQETEVYAVMATGAYRYDARAHHLELAVGHDLRAASGLQDFVADAPLNLVYVADFARMHEAMEPEREFLAGADAGFIAQNVYLFCAAAGLATVVRGLIDRRALSRALQLEPTRRVTLAQSVGHPIQGCRS